MKISLSDQVNITCRHLLSEINRDPSSSTYGCFDRRYWAWKLTDFPEVFALGDCAAITDSATGKPYPPTAQHAKRESKVVSQNLKNLVTCNGNLKEFSYQSKGMMATIGNRTGVVSIFGYNLKGFAAWFIWRSYYLSSLPTMEKKAKVAFDWTLDLLFKRDVTLIGKIKKKELNKIHIGDVPSLKEQLFADL